MGFFGRLLGTEDNGARRMPAPGGAPDDAQAIERYRYMVRTAPPETLERAYAEALAKLTPAQRERVRAELGDNAPPAERAAIEATAASDTQALAQLATRAEIRQPGAMERALGGSAGGFGTSLLSSFAMGFVGSMVAQSFFSAIDGFGGEDGALADAGAADDNEGDYLDEDGGDFGDDGGDFEV